MDEKELVEIKALNAGDMFEFVTNIGNVYMVTHVKYEAGENELEHPTVVAVELKTGMLFHTRIDGIVRQVNCFTVNSGT